MYVLRPLQYLLFHNQGSIPDIPIVDAAIPKTINASDIYDPYARGSELKAFITNPDGSEYVGQVWPGFTVFPDWFAPNAQQYWTEVFANWSALGVEYDGIWLDMNEASSFCDGSWCVYYIGLAAVFIH
jgi:alpha-glucosidase